MEQGFGGGYASRVMPNFEIVPDPSEMMGSMGSEALRAFVETLKAHPDQIRSNRNVGMILILLTERLGYTYATAYRLVYPSRRCSDASAANHVRRLKKHHRETYPMGINEALEVNGVTIEGIVEDIQAERNATKYRWNNDTGDWEPTNVPDYPTRRAARRELREWVNLDQKVRQELAVGKAEMKKMHLNTGMKFDTIQEWIEYMEGEDEKLQAERAQAARDMRRIAQGRQIIQEVGEKEAEKMRQTALAAGLTGDEPDDDEVEPSPPAGRQ